MKTSLGPPDVATFFLTYEAGELFPEETTFTVTVDLTRLRPVALRTRWNHGGKASVEHGIVTLERRP